MSINCSENLSAELELVVNCFPQFDAVINFSVVGNNYIVEIGENKFVHSLPELTGDSITDKRLFLRGAKKALYLTLSDFCSLELPWGALTGIRPTKLAYEGVGQGERDIAAYMRNEYFVSQSKAQLIADIVKSQTPYVVHDQNKVSIYVHIPFCNGRCNYCSFVSLDTSKFHYLIEPYVRALVVDIERSLAHLEQVGMTVDSIYIGGGTPTCLDENQLASVLQPLSGFGVEFTVEAGRPDTITEGKLAVMKGCNVTRVSVNPQTFSNKTLQRIGRKHTVEEIIEKYTAAKRYGFDVNMDLIAGLSGENVEDFALSIDKTLELCPENVTVHTLALKNGSKLFEKGAREDESAICVEVSKMVDYAREKLSQKYVPYYLYRQKYMLSNLENVGYSLPGKVCRNNVTVMEEFLSVMACGAGGISKRIFGNRLERLAELRDVTLYLEQFESRLEKKKKFFS